MTKGKILFHLHTSFNRASGLLGITESHFFEGTEEECSQLIAELELAKSKNPGFTYDLDGLTGIDSPLTKDEAIQVVQAHLQRRS